MPTIRRAAYADIYHGGSYLTYRGPITAPQPTWVYESGLGWLPVKSLHIARSYVTSEIDGEVRHYEWVQIFDKTPPGSPDFVSAQAFINEIDPDAFGFLRVSFRPGNYFNDLWNVGVTYWKQTGGGPVSMGSANGNSSIGSLDSGAVYQAGDEGFGRAFYFTTDGGLGVAVESPHVYF